MREVRRGENMKYQEALDYLKSLQIYGNAVKTDSILKLCQESGNPNEGLQIVYLADICGKLSVPAYVTAMLKCAGYRVGRYGALPILDVRESILVNGSPITQKAFCQGIEQIRNACYKLAEKDYPHPTASEIEAALAFWYFREKKCDLVILDDASGKSTGWMQELVEAAKENGCVFRSSPALKATGIRYGIETQRFSYGEYKNLEIHIAGKTQIENALLAIETVRALTSQGFSVSETAVRKGLKEAQCPVQFGIIDKKPMFVVDGADGEEAAKELVQSLELYFANKRILYIMGVLRDQEYEKVIALTHKYADQVITVTPPQNPRAMSAYDLAVEVARVHPQVTAVDSLEEAVEISGLLAGKEDVILAFGSPVYLGRLIQIAESRKGLRPKG